MTPGRFKQLCVLGILLVERIVYYSNLQRFTKTKRRSIVFADKTAVFVDIQQRITLRLFTVTALMVREHSDLK